MTQAELAFPGSGRLFRRLMAVRAAMQGGLKIERTGPGLVIAQHGVDTFPHLRGGKGPRTEGHPVTLLQCAHFRHLHTHASANAGSALHFAGRPRSLEWSKALASVAMGNPGQQAVCRVQRPRSP